MNDFEIRITEITGDALRSVDIRTLQLNLGFQCNQECVHCHLGASPRRPEMMQWATMESVLDLCKELQPDLVDLTGGAPELNSHFRRFVEALREKDYLVQVRTNLTVMSEPGMETLPEFFREHEVRLTASLPCYLKEEVDMQRGPHVYERSINAIRRLNSKGYGWDERLPLNLVYNPLGPFLPPDPSALEAEYRRELGTMFGITFSRLLTITNMPIGRFLASLRTEKQEQRYLQLLRDAFNPDTILKLMCRHQLCVGWDGGLYDCDFNLAMRRTVNHGAPDHLRDFELSRVKKRRIVTGEHCFGCTAGSGSSCEGALA